MPGRAAGPLLPLSLPACLLRPCLPSDRTRQTLPAIAQPAFRTTARTHRACIAPTLARPVRRVCYVTKAVLLGLARGPVRIYPAQVGRTLRHSACDHERERPSVSHLLPPTHHHHHHHLLNHHRRRALLTTGHPASPHPITQRAGIRGNAEPLPGMPAITLINDTLLPLHIALKQVSPLYYQNNVPPHSSATFHPGKVFFTVEARIARVTHEGAPSDNAYTHWDTYVPIVAVSLVGISLGAGAVYIASTAVAAGSIAATTAALSADAAASVPTLRRLYKYAQKGQRVVQIGQVIGIGGGAATASHAANHSDKKKAKSRSKLLQSISSSVHGGESQPGNGTQPISPDPPGSSSEVAATPQDPEQGSVNQKRNYAEKITVRALRGLLEGSVLKSYGWYTNRDRTLRIVGGPRAAEVDGYLVVETDTFEPFRVIDEEGRTVITGNETGPEDMLTPKELSESTSEKTDGPGEKELLTTKDSGSHPSDSGLQKLETGNDEKKTESIAPPTGEEKGKTGPEAKDSTKSSPDLAGSNPVSEARDAEGAVPLPTGGDMSAYLGTSPQNGHSPTTPPPWQKRVAEATAAAGGAMAEWKAYVQKQAEAKWSEHKAKQSNAQAQKQTDYIALEQGQQQPQERTQVDQNAQLEPIDKAEPAHVAGRSDGPETDKNSKAVDGLADQVNGVSISPAAAKTPGTKKGDESSDDEIPPEILAASVRDAHAAQASGDWEPHHHLLIHDHSASSSSENEDDHASNSFGKPFAEEPGPIKPNTKASNKQPEHDGKTEPSQPPPLPSNHPGDSKRSSKEVKKARGYGYPSLNSRLRQPSEHHTSEDERAYAEASQMYDMPPSLYHEPTPLEKLSEMGYGYHQAREALDNAGGDLHLALERLLSSHPAPPASSHNQEESDVKTPTIPPTAAIEKASVSSAANQPENEKGKMTSNPSAQAAPSDAQPSRVLPILNHSALSEHEGKPWIAQASTQASKGLDKVQGTPYVGPFARAASSGLRAQGEAWLQGRNQTKGTKRKVALQAAKEAWKNPEPTKQNDK